MTFVCGHLAANPKQQWISSPPDESNQWPDAWCAECDALFQEEGEWNESNEKGLNVKILCHHCYEFLRGWRASS
jgi:hypothetical protein